MVVPRRSWRDIFLGKTGDRHKERKKEQKRKKTEALWKLTPLMEIRSQRGFPQRLGKLTKRFPQFPQGPTVVLQKGLDSPAGWGQIKRSKGAKSS
jgi:hypothetical protein